VAFCAHEEGHGWHAAGGDPDAHLQHGVGQNSEILVGVIVQIVLEALLVVDVGGGRYAGAGIVLLIP
jgi:hypothetical protein